MQIIENTRISIIKVVTIISFAGCEFRNLLNLIVRVATLLVLQNFFHNRNYQLQRFVLSKISTSKGAYNGGNNAIAKYEVKVSHYFISFSQIISLMIGKLSMVEIIVKNKAASKSDYAFILQV